MPLFYFDLSVDGQAVIDPEGVQLAKIDEARFEAALALAEMMVNAIKEGTHRSMDITIRDDSRKPLARVSILIREDQQ